MVRPDTRLFGSSHLLFPLCAHRDKEISVDSDDVFLSSKLFKVEGKIGFPYRKHINTA